MLPTLSPGDRLLAIRTDRVRRGDVWVVRFHDQALVKRIAGLPGDRVSVGEGRARISESTPMAARLGPQPDRSWVLGPDEYIVLGDNAAESTDLRAFGPLGAESLIGRVLFRYWPRPGLIR
jgi:signal peptidase I